MSELINTSIVRSNFRWQLLTTVSALALIGNVYGVQRANADGDGDRPTVWIELGGQLERQTGQGDPYLVPFVANNPDSVVFEPVSPLHFEKPPLFSNGADGKINFEPEDTNWVFSAEVRYGRSVGHRDHTRTHLATHEAHATKGNYVGTQHITTPNGYQYTKRIRGPVRYTYLQHVSQLAEADVTQAQSHAIVDFAAGKDFGIGMFGSSGNSTVNIGVRFAQFTSKVSGTINARPDAEFPKGYNTLEKRFYERKHPSFDTRYPWAVFRYYGTAHHTYAAKFQSRRNFHGVGPALSWNASQPILGDTASGTSLNVDWGANAALLFGRQRASGSHQSYGAYKPGLTVVPPTHHTNAGSFNRSRTIIVPNIGGFAGLSFNFTNAKVALGYRGDFFFGAMDAGNDMRETKTVGFYGPFASISIGIGG